MFIGVFFSFYEKDIKNYFCKKCGEFISKILLANFEVKKIIHF